MSYCYPNEYEVIVVGGGNAEGEVEQYDILRKKEAE